MAERAPSIRQQTLVGVGVAVVGLLLAVGATFIPSAAGYAGVGPNFLPWVVAVVTVLLGGWLIRDARTGGWRALDPPSGADRPDLPALAWVCAGLAANAALLTTIGFILACTLCFVLAVRGLRGAEGRPHGGVRGVAIDAATGFLIAAPAYWLFSKLLGISLPGITGTGWL